MNVGDFWIAVLAFVGLPALFWWVVNLLAARSERKEQRTGKRTCWRNPDL